MAARLLARWLELHVEDDFRDQVAWLRDRLDRAGGAGRERQPLLRQTRGAPIEGPSRHADRP